MVTELTKDDLERQVYKVGARTSLTTGVIEKLGRSYKRGHYSLEAQNSPITFRNQLEIRTTTQKNPVDNMRTLNPFFDKGDSGSVVFIMKNEILHPIGIASAFRKPTPTGCVYFATPLFAIKSLLENFCPSIRFLSFQTNSDNLKTTTTQSTDENINANK